MPETKNLGIDRSLGLAIDTSAITFKDKAREKKRQEAIVERLSLSRDRQAERTALRKKYEAWSNKHDREDLKLARRDRRKRRMEAKRVAKLTPQQLEEKRELDELVHKVRQQNDEAMEATRETREDFAGFDD